MSQSQGRAERTSFEERVADQEQALGQPQGLKTFGTGRTPRHLLSLHVPNSQVDDPI